MSPEMTRRSLVCKMVPASAVLAGLSLEEQILRAQESRPPSPPPPPRESLPTGKIGKHAVSRLILGGNLIGGWAHARDLMYVSALLKRYFTEEKILETMALAESQGINTINIHPNATAVVQRYWKEGRGKMLCMMQGFIDDSGSTDGLKKEVDDGAHAIYIQGNVGDEMVRRGKIDLIGKAVDFIRSQGIPAGVAAHQLSVVKACEENRIPVDFYVKTLHQTDYWSAKRPEQKDDVVSNRADNFWCVNPEETIAYMKTVRKPWIAYKVMAAGAIHPNRAFPYAFRGGADFIVAGIFDFQVQQDVQIALDALSKAKNRERPWMA